MRSLIHDWSAVSGPKQHILFDEAGVIIGIRKAQLGMSERRLPTEDDVVDAILGAR